MLFNRAKIFNSYRGPLQFPGPGPAIMDIRRVFLHELGHALGLTHPDTGGQQVVAVMNSIMSNQEVLSPDDHRRRTFPLRRAFRHTDAHAQPPPPTPSPTATPLRRLSPHEYLDADENRRLRQRSHWRFHRSEERSRRS